MNRILLALLNFVSTFSIGLLITIPNTEPAEIRASSQDPIPAPTELNRGSTRQEGKEEAGIEFHDLPDLEGPRHFNTTANLIDVFAMDGIYRESEVIAKSGEQWLTLVHKNGTSSLITSTARVTKKRTISYPGDEYDVQLSFSNNVKPVFAIRNLPLVRPGKVETVYHRPSNREIELRNLPIDPMKTGYKRDFNLVENWYTLRVSRGKTKSGTTVGVLVLEHGAIKQIIAQNYYESSHDEIIGNLYWVGDLDRDGKLDLYFDEFNEKGYFAIGLYLSSSAEPGKLVKLVGEFNAAGC